jgi:hypothetical protein
MARRKTLPESIRTKQTLSERLASLRAELFGDRGGPELARRLGLPIRTWYNYEAGVTVPAEVILKIIELTSVEPMWLLHGRGPKYRRSNHESRSETVLVPGTSVGALLRTALDLIERGDNIADFGVGGGLGGGFGESDHTPSAEPRLDLSGESEPGSHEGHGVAPGQRYSAARSDWLDAQRENRCIRVAGNAMAPIIADGAYVAFAKAEEPPADLDGKIVVALIDGHPIVRWFHHHGRFALLRAENTTTEPAENVIDLEERGRERWFRRVLWINTPH